MTCGAALLATVTVRGADTLDAPPLSVARAVSAYVPAGTLLHVNAYGDVVSVPTSAPPAKNSTFVTEPLVSVAVAARLIVAGAAYVAPDAGAESATVGGGLVLVSVIVIGVEVAVELVAGAVLSVAFAVSVAVPTGAPVQAIW